MNHGREGSIGVWMSSLADAVEFIFILFALHFSKAGGSIGVMRLNISKYVGENTLRSRSICIFRLDVELPWNRSVRSLGRLPFERQSDRQQGDMCISLCLERLIAFPVVRIELFMALVCH
jgi:hypothetical protein